MARRNRPPTLRSTSASVHVNPSSARNHFLIHSGSVQVSKTLRLGARQSRPTVRCSADSFSRVMSMGVSPAVSAWLGKSKGKLLERVIVDREEVEQATRADVDDAIAVAAHGAHFGGERLSF